MLHRGDYALRLHALNKGDYECGVEVRILRQILEVAAANGRTRNIHTGAEEKIHVPCTRVAPKALADLTREILIPRGRQRHSTRVSRRRAPRAYANRCIGHLEP